MVTWKVAIYDLNAAGAYPAGARVASASFIRATFGYVLNGPGAFEADLAMKNADVTRTNWEPGQREIRVYRNASGSDVLVWGGYLWNATVELRDRVTVRAEGYSSRLRRRNVMADLTYSGVAQEQIAWNLIAHTQAQGSGALGLTQGAHSGASINRSRDYCLAEHPEILASIDELTGLDDGLDYEVTPAPDSAVNKSFKTYQARKGADRTGSVTLSGSNLMALSYEIDANDVASRVITSDSDDCTPDEVDITDSTALTNFGLLQDYESIDSHSLADTQAHANETLRNLKNAHWTAQADYIDPNGPAWNSFVVGDRVTVASARGFATFSVPMRVLSHDVTLEANHVANRVTLDSVVS